MDPLNFCYWLQGYIELTKETNPTFNVEQTKIIVDHLKLVFNKVTPNRELDILQTRHTGVIDRPLCGTVPVSQTYC